MSPEELVGKVLDVPARLVDDSTSNTTLAEWDSLAHINLIMELETTFGIVLSAEDALSLTDVGTIKRLLRTRGVTW
jgi:acyl carrier protein